MSIALLPAFLGANLLSEPKIPDEKWRGSSLSGLADES